MKPPEGQPPEWPFQAASGSPNSGERSAGRVEKSCKKGEFKKKKFLLGISPLGTPDFRMCHL